MTTEPADGLPPAGTHAPAPDAPLPRSTRAQQRRGGAGADGAVRPPGRPRRAALGASGTAPPPPAAQATPPRTAVVDATRGAPPTTTGVAVTVARVAGCRPLPRGRRRHRCRVPGNAEAKDRGRGVRRRRSARYHHGTPSRTAARRRPARRPFQGPPCPTVHHRLQTVGRRHPHQHRGMEQPAARTLRRADSRASRLGHFSSRDCLVVLATLARALRNRREAAPLPTAALPRSPLRAPEVSASE